MRYLRGKRVQIYTFLLSEDPLFIKEVLIFPVLPPPSKVVLLHSFAHSFAHSV